MVMNPRRIVTLHKSKALSALMVTAFLLALGFLITMIAGNFAAESVYSPLAIGPDGRLLLHDDAQLTIKVSSVDAQFKNFVGLAASNGTASDLLQCTTTTVGASKSVQVMATDDLRLMLHTPEGRYYSTGPGYRNPDGMVHARVTERLDGSVLLEWEDSYGGWDQDFNDCVVTLTAVAQASNSTPSPIATASLTPSAAPARTPAPTPTPTIAPTPAATPTPSAPTPTASSAPGSSMPAILFGLGSEADGAINAPLTTSAPVWMLTSWYNGPNDLNWMKYWKSNLVPNSYAKGYAMHLIVWSGGAETGTPCGRQYPIGDQIENDMRTLAQIFGGPASGPPLYVTLFTEFQTFPCQDNQWVGAEDYYSRLKTKMLRIRDIFHAGAPNSRVGIGWGGWQVRYDDPAKGGGRSLFPYFQDVMQQMDFQSFQAMQSDGNVNDIRENTRILGKYGPVMLAHYKPDNSSQATFDNDTKAMLTDSYLAEVKNLGLFAWSFMDQTNLSASQETFQRVAAAVQRYGVKAGAPTPLPPPPPPSTTATASPAPTPTPAKTPGPSYTGTPAPLSTSTPTITPTRTPTATPTRTAAPLTPTPTPSPTAKPSSTPASLTPTATPTATPVPAGMPTPGPCAGCPYPRSPLITSFNIDLASYNKLGNGDNWPVTWAADGEQYTIFADGSGFNGGGDLTFGLGKISGATGDTGAWSGSEPPSNGNLPSGYGSGGRKASGLIQVNGVLYAAVRNLSGQNGSNLRRSLDGGLNWEWASWSWPEFGYPFFINMGQNYGANTDGYVYLYSPTSSNAYATSDGLWLARVPKAEIWSQSSWQYFSGFAGNGNPTWSSSIASRQPVFNFPGHTYRPGAVYNPGLGRYMVSMMLRTSEGVAPVDALYVFDAPTPWGPWTTVYRNEAFSSVWPGGQDEDPFHPNFPPKWISADGRTMYLQWSCYPCSNFYAFNVAKVTLEVWRP